MGVALSALLLVPLRALAAEESPQLVEGEEADAADAADARSDNGPGFGLYLDAEGAALFALSSTHEWSESCPAVNLGSESWQPECSTSAPLGALLQGRLGMRFGYLGVEGFGLAAIDWSAARFDDAIPGLPSSASTMAIGRVGGGLGAGLRLMSAPGLFRASAGAGGGIMFRHVYTSISSLDGASDGYHAPFVSFDVTLTLLGFVNLGVMGLVEFPSDVAVSPDFSGIDDAFVGAQVESEIGQVTVFSGPQFFIGPKLGIHFGG